MMMSRLGTKACLFALALGMISFAGASFAKEYIVKFKDPGALKQVASQKSLAGALITDTYERGGLMTIDFGKNALKAEAEKIAQLLKRPDVAYVVENVKLHAFGIPDDPRFHEQWSLAKVRASEAWDTNVGSRDITVAVIDTGINWSHPDLAGQIWQNTGEVAGNGVDDDGNGYVDDIRGWDFFANDNDPDDETGAQNPGHGTHCAGIVGATGNNGTGISGMAQNITLMPVRFLGANGSGDLMAGARAIDYAADNGAQVISASWGAAIQEAQAQPVTEAIARANDKGVIFVAAAANDGANNDSRSVYPANTDLPNVISVAASNSSDGKPQWSNYGKKKVHLASPGEGILSTLPGNSYDNLSGTSMATPLVSGLVALLLSENPNLDGPAVKAIMQQTGADVAIETACDCRVDAKAAIDAVTADALIPTPTAKTYEVGDTDSMSAIGGAGGYKFTSANPEVITVSETGSLEAKSLGETRVTVEDSSGATTESLLLRVAEPGSSGGDCPFPDPLMCQLLCGISPELPWCQ